MTTRAEAADALQVRAIVPPSEVALGDRVVVQIDGLSVALTSNEHKPSDFVLYLDRQELKDTTHTPTIGPGKDQIGFVLARTPDNKATWAAMLGSPAAWSRTLHVNVRLRDASNMLPEVANSDPSITLDVIRPWGLGVGLVFIALVVVGLFQFGRRSDMLRDSQPTDFAGVASRKGRELRRPFSLAQVQMAWWLVLVVCAYVFLFLITGDINTFSAQALTLMGIGTGIALGATMIEQNKTNTTLKQFQDTLSTIASLESQGAADATLAPLRTKRDLLARQLASTDFFNDILTDVDGVSLHRFQLLIWTLVLGCIFCVEVYRNLALPEFDATMLALLGISGGTYLGFKVPEQPA